MTIKYLVQSKFALKGDESEDKIVSLFAKFASSPLVQISYLQHSRRGDPQAIVTLSSLNIPPLCKLQSGQVWVAMSNRTFDYFIDLQRHDLRHFVSTIDKVHNSIDSSGGVNFNRLRNDYSYIEFTRDCRPYRQCSLMYMDADSPVLGFPVKGKRWLVLNTAQGVV